jgi:surface polysaccharide O-acyltransferase-like enzyme
VDGTWRPFELVSCKITCVTVFSYHPILGSLVVLRSYWRRLNIQAVAQYLTSSQGILGSFLIKLNVKIAIYRKNTIIGDWPILEVVCVSAITAAVSYLVSSSSISLHFH